MVEEAVMVEAVAEEAPAVVEPVAEPESVAAPVVDEAVTAAALDMARQEGRAEMEATMQDCIKSLEEAMQAKQKLEEDKDLMGSACGSETAQRLHFQQGLKEAFEMTAERELVTSAETEKLQNTIRELEMRVETALGGERATEVLVEDAKLEAAVHQTNYNDELAEKTELSIKLREMSAKYNREKKEREAWVAGAKQLQEESIKHITELEGANKELQSKLDAQVSAGEKLEESLSQAEFSAKEGEAELAKANTEQDKLREQLAEAEANLLKLGETLEQTKKEKETAERAEKVAKVDAQSYEEDKKRAQTEVSNLKVDLMGLQEALAANNSQGAPNNQVKTLEDKLRAVQKEHEQTKSELEEVSAVCNDTINELEKMKELQKEGDALSASAGVEV
jgi:hypothetical protein